MKNCAIFLLLVLLFTGCGKKAEKSQNSESNAAENTGYQGKPDKFRIEKVDSEIEAAMTRARETLGEFMAALQSAQSNQRDFMVKKSFKAGSKVEHLWITDLVLEGNSFYGVVANKPLDTKEAKYGDAVGVVTNEIADWMYIEDDKMVGGHTIRVLFNRYSPAEKESFLAENGFSIQEISK